MTKKSIKELYLETLIYINDWVTVSEWANRFGEANPELFKKADEQAKNQAKPSTGHRELAARIGSLIAEGKYLGKIEVDSSERPRKVRYLEKADSELESDLEEVSRDEEIKTSEARWSEQDRYRYDEFDKIKKQLGSFLGTSFHLDHAAALKNKGKPGSHHPDNIQILIQGHNSKKSNQNWKRFTLDEQVEYILKIVESYEIIVKKNKLDFEKEIVESLINRLRLVY